MYISRTIKNTTFDEVLKLQNDLEKKALIDKKELVLKGLLACAHERGDVASTVKYYKSLSKLGGKSYLAELKNLEFYVGNWGAYCTYAEQAEKDGVLQAEGYVRWYMALKYLEDDESASVCLRKFKLLSIGNPEIQLQAAYLFARNGFYEEALDYYEKVMMISKYDSDRYYDVLENINLYFPIYAEESMWKPAHGVAQVHKYSVLLTVSSKRSSPPGRSVSIGNHADFCKGMMLLEQGNDSGKKWLRRCVDKSVGGGSLAEVFFPALREAGYKDIHDESFEKIKGVFEDVLKKYPKSANTYNSYAWLAARACKNLAKAKEHSKLSLKLEPHNPNYIDTLAEISFANGNRAKAVELSKEAVAESLCVRYQGLGNVRSAIGHNRVLRRQLEHFKNDPLPDN